VAWIVISSLMAN